MSCENGLIHTRATKAQVRLGISTDWSGLSSLFSITYCRIQWFCEQIMRSLIRLHSCASLSRLRCPRLHKSRNVWKRTFGHLRPKKAQVFLRIRAVWSESSLSARRNFSSLTVQICVQWRFRSACANAQADLNLRWAHMSEGTFPDVSAHKILWVSFYFIGQTALFEHSRMHV